VIKNKDGIAKIDIKYNNKIYECLVDENLWHELTQSSFNIQFKKLKRTDKCYVVRAKDGELIHHIVMNRTGDTMIDHINGNPLDNRKCNLRVTNASSNSHNIIHRKNKYVGVRQRGTYINGDIRYCADISRHGKKQSAYFKNEKEAVEWRNQKAIELYGEFASLQVWVPENSV
jgi:hypothetical protein